MATPPDRRAHWSAVYAKTPDTGLSWYQAIPSVSLAMIEAANVGPDARIIDVGGGAARLVDRLLDRGFRNLTVLDVVPSALDAARRRLGERAAGVTWIEADVISWRPDARYDVWHDRALFHFLADRAERRPYVATLKSAIAPLGHVVIGTFAPDGPARCSGLPVTRYGAEALADELGAGFDLVDHRQDDHITPAGKTQGFQFCRFRRRAEVRLPTDVPPRPADSARVGGGSR